MRRCSEIQDRIALYIDREVNGAEALEIEAHLIDCVSCRKEHDELRGVVDAVRGKRPLYDPPEGSYLAARQIVEGWETRHHRRRWAMAAAAALVLAAIPAIWLSTGRSEYQHFAVQAHRNFARGALTLEVSSSQPKVVSDWLAPRIPFHLALPNYPEGGRKRYALAGAKLMRYRGVEVAYLAYEMDRKPISLMITSSSMVLPSLGERYQSGGLTFYFSSEQGLRVITWKDKGLTYAQVSDLDVKGAESCAICHGAEGERPKFEGLGNRM